MVSLLIKKDLHYLIYFCVFIALLLPSKICELILILKGWIHPNSCNPNLRTSHDPILSLLQPQSNATETDDYIIQRIYRSSSSSYSFHGSHFSDSSRTPYFCSDVLLETILAVLEDLQVDQISRMDALKDKEKICEICAEELEFVGGEMDDYGRYEMEGILFGCGHMFCLDCLSSFFSIQIREKQSPLLTCPHHSHPSLESLIPSTQSTFFPSSSSEGEGEEEDRKEIFRQEEEKMTNLLDKVAALSEASIYVPMGWILNETGLNEAIDKIREDEEGDKEEDGLLVLGGGGNDTLKSTPYFSPTDCSLSLLQKLLEDDLPSLLARNKISQFMTTSPHDFWCIGKGCG